MPVYKRAARPTAAPASDDPRDPQSSDNDFTVLFDRARVTAPAPPPDRFPRPRYEQPPRANPRRAEPTRRAAPGPEVWRPIEAPRAAPRPPVVARSFPVRGEIRIDPDRETPLGMAVSPTDPIAQGDPTETIVVAPALRERILRVGALFAIGGLLGVGVELGVHTASPGAPPAETLVHVTAAPVAAPPPTDLPQAPPAPAPIFDDKAPVVQVHRHHVHHPSTSASASADGAVGADAGAPASEADDDVAAAVRALTKAKEEVTLP